MSMVTECVNLVLKHNGDVFAAYASIRTGMKEALKQGRAEEITILENHFKDVIVETAMKEHGYEKGFLGIWYKEE